MASAAHPETITSRPPIGAPLGRAAIRDRERQIADQLLEAAQQPPRGDECVLWDFLGNQADPQARKTTLENDIVPLEVQQELEELSQMQHDQYLQEFELGQ